MDGGEVSGGCVRVVASILGGPPRSRGGASVGCFGGSGVVVRGIGVGVGVGAARGRAGGVPARDGRVPVPRRCSVGLASRVCGGARGGGGEDGYCGD